MLTFHLLSKESLDDKRCSDPTSMCGHPFGYSHCYSEIYIPEDHALYMESEDNPFWKEPNCPACLLIGLAENECQESTQ